MRIPTKLWIPVLTLLAGAVAGYLLGRGRQAGGRRAAAEGQYYICEIHGHLHDGPGICPIGGAKLKPVVKMDLPGEKGERKVKFWRSPMDPMFVSKGPGKDNMGMDLVPVYEGDPETQMGVVTISSQVMLQMGIRTATLKHGDLVRRIRTVGNVTYNEETLGTVTTKLNVWVDKLYVDKTGQSVKVGDPLLEIYSKELEAAQTAFLDSLNDPRLTSTKVSEAERGRAAALLESARRRLAYWDIPEDQIELVAKEGKIHRTLVLRSRFSGIVTKKIAVEGRFFKAGTPLFEIADLATVWVYGRIYEFERPWVKEGQEAKISLSYIPGRTYDGIVEFVYPYLNEKTRDITIRMRFPNPENVLLPGMWANVALDCSLGTHALLVPEDAVLDTGTRKIVFVVTGPGQFEGRDVSLGVRSAGGMWEVLDGLKDGERVVVSGQFMLDAESKVREAIRKFLAAEDEAKPAGGGEAGPGKD